MKFLISNLRLLVRRFKSVAIINVVGLGVAFAVTLVVAKQVWWDVTYDRGFDNAGTIHMSEIDWGTGGGPRPGMNQQIPELWTERVPELRSYCLIGTSWGQTPFMRVEDGEVSRTEGAQAVFHYASKGFLELFTPEIVAGDASETLLAPGRCIISEKTARAIFGEDDPVGRTIASFPTGELVVDAVYRDFPENSSISSGVYTMLAPESNSGMFNYLGYFMFPHQDLPRVMERVNDPVMLAETEDVNNNYAQYSYYLTEMSDMYLRGGATGEGGQWGNMIYLLVVGLFVLIVATINFVNLSMAMAPARVRGVNIHRILGIGKAAMRASLAMECVLTAVSAIVLGGALVHWFAGSTHTGFFTAPLALDAAVGLTVCVVAGLLVVAFVVGLYSARYASSFEVAIALKSSFALSRRGTRLRNTLIVVQFATAIFFICFSAAVTMQYRYMSNYAIGYEKENIVTFDGGPRKVSAEVFANELKRNPEIIDVTSAHEMPGRIGSFSGTQVGGKQVAYYTWSVAENFFDFFGIAATPGRLDAGMHLYTPDGMLYATSIFNREFMRRFDFTEADMEGLGYGVTEDIHFESLHEPVKPMSFMTLPELEDVMPYIFVKITGRDVAATMKYIEDTWKTLSGSQGVSLTFLDDEMDALYRRESNMARLVGILGLVAVLIAVMGVYGLAMFNTRYKTREIAIRKVNGARRREVVMMLNRGMVTQVAVAFVLTVPLAVWIVGRWIGAFAYRTSIPWWLWPAAGAAVLLVAVATVSYQSWRAASANPVKALMAE